MKSFDITLYGHLSYDNIYEGFDYKTSVGCMGNVWNQLKLINPDLKVKLEPTDIGESLILSITEQCKRTSISRLSLKTRTPVIHDSELSHVMYLNELSDTTFISNLKGYVTADVCNGKKLNLKDPALKRINLLMISDEDLEGINLENLFKCINGHVVVHYPNGSIITMMNGISYRQTAELVPNTNVLGAGDKLAAYILSGLLEDNMNLPKVLQQAHNRLTEYFKNEKV